NRPEEGLTRRMHFAPLLFCPPSRLIESLRPGPEHRALLRSNPSTEPGPGRKRGRQPIPLASLPSFRTGTNALNLGGLGAKPPDKPTSHLPARNSAERQGRPFL